MQVAAAMNNLGLLLAEAGRTEEAEQWYRRAAEAGHIKAMYNLGLLAKGQGQPDEAEALVSTGRQCWPRSSHELPSASAAAQKPDEPKKQNNGTRRAIDTGDILCRCQ